MTDQPVTDQPWIATEATVTACRYQSPGLSTLAFGFQTGEKFRIAFDYYAHGRLYSDEFQSPTAIPQNEHIPITYNPLHPEQNSRGQGSGTAFQTTRPPILIIGIIGSIFLSLLWLVVLHSCR
ncbi:hypothetical protein RBB79_05465 [Tunturiibacter empetritectus]|uniref:DUF3592 domain-containing protein n=1 Tax=Tunturiibacter lichenicola TaxID=2051959 RepID=A0A852V7S3_9BACT|nr:hypothetical protein [Edaphobacter lichenicola]NYF88973.1 hypothetical protein [Edaphobacter lichenicola]